MAKRESPGETITNYIDVPSVDEYIAKVEKLGGKVVLPKTAVPGIGYRDILGENDLVIVMLEHIDYFLKIYGKSSPYGYAAYSISRLKEPLSTMKGDLRKMSKLIILLTGGGIGR
jgi:hypothetical protein